MFALLLAAGTLRLLRVRRFTGFQRCLVLLGLLLLLSLARGATVFGIEHSVAESRLYLPFVSAALYFATFPPSNALNDRIGKLWLAMSVPMMVLVCLRWLAVFGGIDVGVPAAEFGADAAVKVIDGPYTFFLAMRRGADGAVLAASRPAGTTADAVGRGAAAVRGAAEPPHRLAHAALGVAVVMLRERRLGRPARPCWWRPSPWSPSGSISPSRAPGREPGREPSRLRSRPPAPAPSNGASRDGPSCMPAGRLDPTHWVIGQPFGTGFTRNVLRGD